MRKNPVTIIDIAKKLGVSKSTISRALRDHPDISDEMKKKVQKIARKLNYHPNAIATNFRNRRSGLIGLIMPQISPFFFPSVIKGIEEFVHDKGFNLMILQSNEKYEREVENLEILAANNVEGILVSVSRETTNIDHFKRILKTGIPLVFFDRVVNELNVDTVLVDDVTASFNAVNHLLESGCKRIAICTGNMNLLISRNRLQGYKTALQNRGIPIDERLIVSAEWTEEAEALMMKLLKLKNPPDGVFAISDLTMSGVMRGIISEKIKVPEQMSVIGFCEEPFSLMYNPKLTAIEPMGYEIGQKSAEILFDRINEENVINYKHKIVYLDGKITVRGSTNFNG